MLLSTEQLVQQIHDSPTRIVLVATGGGSRAIADLLDVPGGSRTLLEAVVPYSAPAMIAWLGGLPDEFCSAATARAMAMAAFHRARRYEEPGGDCRRGWPARPAWRPTGRSAARTASTSPCKPPPLTAAWQLQLQKDRRTRAEEERLVGRLLLNVMAAACDVPERLHLDLLEGERVEESRIEAPPAWQDLLLGKVESVRVSPLPVGEGQGVRGGGEGASADSPHPDPLPTSSVPRGDLSRNSSCPGPSTPCTPAIAAWSRSPRNCSVSRRPSNWRSSTSTSPRWITWRSSAGSAQFPAEQTVYLSRAATFEEKSRLFAGATFLVGADTLQRIAGPQYYGNSLSACQCAIQRIAGRGCRFLVFGRNLGGSFIRLGDLDLPDSLRALCREVPPELFREDVSSTALRKAGER